MDSALSAGRGGVKKQKRENGIYRRERESDDMSRDHKRKLIRRDDTENIWAAERRGDPRLDLSIDPRATAPLGKAQRALLGKGVGTGRNTESFDPKTTHGRPMMRFRIGSNRIERFDGELSHDDLIIVPEFACAKDDWSLYYKLIEELKDTNDFIPWHEGAHLLTKKPEKSATYREIQAKMAQYFRVKEAGTRFNWYINDTDWKPAHHDSAAFNRARSKQQNCTVGITFGSSRELFFCDAHDPSKRFYFPQENGMLYFFGRDVNIRFKHGVNQIPPDKRDGKGRISIILWGLIDAPNEADSPPMLTDDSRPVYDGRQNRAHHDPSSAPHRATHPKRSRETTPHQHT